MPKDIKNLLEESADSADAIESLKKLADTEEAVSKVSDALGQSLTKVSDSIGSIGVSSAGSVKGMKTIATSNERNVTVFNKLVSSSKAASKELRTFTNLVKGASGKVGFEVDVSGVEQLENLKVLSKETSGKVEFDVDVSGAEQLENLKVLSETGGTIEFDVDVSGVDQLEQLRALSEDVSDKIEFRVDVSGADQLEQLRALSKGIGGKIEFDVDVTGGESLLNLFDLSQKITGSKVGFEIDVAGGERLLNLFDLSQEISGSKIQFEVDAGNTVEVTDAVGELKDQTIFIDTDADTGKIAEVTDAVGELKDQTIAIDTDVKGVQELQQLAIAMDDMAKSSQNVIQDMFSVSEASLKSEKEVSNLQGAMKAASDMARMLSASLDFRQKIDTVTGAFAELSDELAGHSVTTSMQAVQKESEEVTKKMEAMRLAGQDSTEEYRILQDQLGNLTAIQNASRGFEDLTNAQKQQGSLTSSQIRQYKALIEQIKQLDKIHEVSDAMERLSHNIQNNIGDISRQQSSLNELQAEFAKLERLRNVTVQLEVYSEALKNGASLSSAQQAAYEGLRDEAEKLRKGFEDLSDSSGSLRDEIEQQTGLMGLLSQEVEKGRDEFKSFGGTAAKSATGMFAVGVALVYAASKLKDWGDGVLRTQKQFAEFDVKVSKLARATVIAPEGIRQLEGYRDQLALTTEQAGEFFNTLNQGAMTGIISTTALVEAASSLQEIFGGDPTKQLQEYVDLLKEIPTLDMDLSITASMDDQTATWFALAEKGKVSQVIELQMAGLAGGIEAELPSEASETEVALLNEMQSLNKWNEDISKTLHGFIPTFLPMLVAVSGGIVGILMAIRSAAVMWGTTSTATKSIASRTNPDIERAVRESVSKGGVSSGAVVKGEAGTVGVLTKLRGNLNGLAGKIPILGKSLTDNLLAPTTKLGGVFNKLGSIASGFGSKLVGFGSKLVGLIPGIGGALAGTGAGALAGAGGAVAGGTVAGAGALAGAGGAVAGALGTAAAAVAAFALPVLAAAGPLALLAWKGEAAGKAITDFGMNLKEQGGVAGGALSWFGQHLQNVGSFWKGLLPGIAGKFAEITGLIGGGKQKTSAEKHLEELEKQDKARKKVMMDELELRQKSALALEASMNLIKSAADSAKKELSDLASDVATMELEALGEIGGSAATYNEALRNGAAGLGRSFGIMDDGFKKARSFIMKNAEMDTDMRRAALLKLRKAELDAQTKYVQGILKITGKFDMIPAVVSNAIEMQIREARIDLQMDAGMFSVVEDHFANLDAAFDSLAAATEQLDDEYKRSDAAHAKLTERMTDNFEETMGEVKKLGSEIGNADLVTQFEAAISNVGGDIEIVDLDKLKSIRATAEAQRNKLQSEIDETRLGVTTAEMEKIEDELSDYSLQTAKLAKVADVITKKSEHLNDGSKGQIAVDAEEAKNKAKEVEIGEKVMKAKLKREDLNKKFIKIAKDEGSAIRERLGLSKNAVLTEKHVSKHYPQFVKIGKEIVKENDKRANNLRKEVAALERIVDFTIDAESQESDGVDNAKRRLEITKNYVAVTKNALSEQAKLQDLLEKDPTIQRAQRKLDRAEAEFELAKAIGVESDAYLETQTSHSDKLGRQLDIGAKVLKKLKSLQVGQTTINAVFEALSKQTSETVKSSGKLAAELVEERNNQLKTALAETTDQEKKKSIQEKITTLGDTNAATERKNIRKRLKQAIDEKKSEVEIAKIRSELSSVKGVDVTAIDDAGAAYEESQKKYQEVIQKNSDAARDGDKEARGEIDKSTAAFQQTRSKYVAEIKKAIAAIEASGGDTTGLRTKLESVATVSSTLTAVAAGIEKGIDQVTTSMTKLELEQLQLAKNYEKVIDAIDNRPLQRMAKAQKEAASAMFDLADATWDVNDAATAYSDMVKSINTTYADGKIAIDAARKALDKDFNTKVKNTEKERDSSKEGSQERLKAEQKLAAMQNERVTKDEKLNERASHLEANRRKDIIDASEKLLQFQMDQIDLRMEERDVQIGFLEEIGASYENILSLQREQIADQANQVRAIRATMASIPEHAREGKQYEGLRLKLIKAETDLQKKALGAQRNAYEKMLEIAFGSIREARGARRQLNSQARIFGRGFVQTRSGLMSKGGARTLEERRGTFAAATGGVASASAEAAAATAAKRGGLEGGLEGGGKERRRTTGGGETVGRPNVPGAPLPSGSRAPTATSRAAAEAERQRAKAEEKKAKASRANAPTASNRAAAEAERRRSKVTEEAERQRAKADECLKTRATEEAKRQKARAEECLKTETGRSDLPTVNKAESEAEKQRSKAIEERRSVTESGTRAVEKSTAVEKETTREEKTRLQAAEARKASIRKNNDTEGRASKLFDSATDEEKKARMEVAEKRAKAAADYKKKRRFELDKELVLRALTGVAEEDDVKEEAAARLSLVKKREASNRGNRAKRIKELQDEMSSRAKSRKEKFDTMQDEMGIRSKETLAEKEERESKDLVNFLFAKPKETEVQKEKDAQQYLNFLLGKSTKEAIPETGPPGTAKVGASKKAVEQTSKMGVPGAVATSAVANKDVPAKAGMATVDPGGEEKTAKGKPTFSGAMTPEEVRITIELRGSMQVEFSDKMFKTKIITLMSDPQVTSPIAKAMINKDIFVANEIKGPG